MQGCLHRGLNRSLERLTSCAVLPWDSALCTVYGRTRAFLWARSCSCARALRALANNHHRWLFLRRCNRRRGSRRLCACICASLGRWSPPSVFSLRREALRSTSWSFCLRAWAREFPAHFRWAWKEMGSSTEHSFYRREKLVGRAFERSSCMGATVAPTALCSFPT